MTSSAESDLLTQTGPGTPCGELMRRYWQPVELSENLPAGGPPIPVRVLSEDLVLFRPDTSGRPDSSGRDEAGQPGLLGLQCAHRGADLSYGRLEDGGLRCIYHGWLYDRSGRCLEQPGEPEGSTFHQRIRQVAYPCVEQAGLIFAYLGPGAPPLLPAYDALTAPDHQRLVTKVFQDCNYLQANEGNLDPTHTSYLHRQFDRGARDVRAGIDGRGEAPNELFARDAAPRLELEETDFGLRIYVIRSASSEMVYLRTSCFVYPNLAAIAGETSGDGYSIHWHVPIDDTHHWRTEVVYRASAPLGTERPLQYHAPVDAAWRLLQNRASRYGQDREEMRARSFSGMGPSFQVADACAVEGQGPIQDRAREHLGYSDRAIVGTRQLLLRAIRQMESGADPPHVIRDPCTNAFPELAALSQLAPKDADFRTCWRTQRA
jgi:phenylpropionate dioxygenase-like ring-hydroxylating dioxygenase large terminal subunit